MRFYFITWIYEARISPPRDYWLKNILFMLVNHLTGFGESLNGSNIQSIQQKAPLAPTPYWMKDIELIYD